MNDPLLLSLMVLSGAGLATAYLAGLWLTLRRIHRQRYPWFWLLASTVLRITLLIAAFYLILGERQWQQLLAALFGFIVMRAMSVRWTRRRLADKVVAGETVP